MGETNNRIIELWNEGSDNWYKKRNTDENIEKIIKDPAIAFHNETFTLIKKFFPDLHGKKVCVPASGDNNAVFAFHLLGAQVTSVDISKQQIQNAESIARKRGWDIEFICDDNMLFDKIKTNEYDFVYTSNGVNIWISDLLKMYQNFNKVLKDNGIYILYDVHPFMRPFEDDYEKLTVAKLYDNIGPLAELSTFHWRMKDIINSIITANFELKMVDEFYANKSDKWWYDSDEESTMDNNRLYDWKQNPLAALPQWVVICAQKKAEY